MHLDQQIDQLGATLGTGRRRLAEVDLGDVLDSALAEVRAAGPERWQPRRRSRWPFVAAALLLGAAAATFVYLLPTLRRAIEGRRLDPDAGPHTVAAGVPEPILYPANSWGGPSEERNDGEETGF